MLAGSVDGTQPLNALSLTELTPGVPVVVMSNTPAVPAANVAWLALVTAGDARVAAARVGVVVRPADTLLVPAGVVTVMFTVPGLMADGIVAVIWLEP